MLELHRIVFYCNRVMRFWLEGLNAGTVETFADLPGYPDNVRKNGRGQFWVAIDCCRTPSQEVMSRNPWLKRVYFRLPISMAYLARWMGMKMFTVISLFNEIGEILEVLEDREGETVIGKRSVRVEWEALDRICCPQSHRYYSISLFI